MTQARLITVIGALIGINVGFVVWAFNDLKGSVASIGEEMAQNSKAIATLLQQNDSQQYWLALHEKRLDGHDAQLQARIP